MSQDADRIAVPSNGRSPHPAGSAATPPGPSASSAEPDDVPSDEELATAFSPARLAVGFGIVASLVVLLAGWARRRRSGG